MKTYKIILSGGGTGGHIYPAVAVAEALKAKLGDRVELLFVGAMGKMEMDKVPALGYDIVGLPITGLQRRFSFKNLVLPFKVLKSLRIARRTIRSFRADIVVGFGGYASGPVLRSAQRMGLPTLIQEQNSYAGITNKILGKRAQCICVAYDGMERFFSVDKIVLTGNPLRGNFLAVAGKHDTALSYFGLSPKKPVLLVVGGSLGTRTLNNMMKRWVDEIVEEGRIQVIWQTGAFYNAEMEAFMSERSGVGVWRGAFIERMDYAYTAADVVVSRAGAGTVSELCLVGKPTIFVPSPNVSENHQTKNAMALVSKKAALMIPDSEAVEMVIPTVLKLLDDENCRVELANNMRSLAIADSAQRVAELVIEVARTSVL